MSGLVSSVRRALSAKLRGPGFRLETSFELNPITEDIQGTFPFLSSFRLIYLNNPI